MGVKGPWTSMVTKMASVGDSVSGRHFIVDAADGDDSSSGGEGFGMSLVICREEVCHMF